MKITTVLIFLLIFAHSYAADELTLAGTAPNIDISTPLAGEILVAGSDSNSTLSFSTNSSAGTRKITAYIDTVSLPEGIEINVATTITGLGSFSLNLSTTAQDFITGISPNTSKMSNLDYTFTVSLEAEPINSNYTIKYEMAPE